jgi:uncharacterized membrane protein
VSFFCEWLNSFLINPIEYNLQLSKSIMSEEGKKLGLIDAIVASEELLKASRLWALDIADRRKPWIRSLHRTDKLGSLSEARYELKIARQQARKIAPNMPQHQACLDVIEEGIVQGGYSGVLKVSLVLGRSVIMCKLCSFGIKKLCSFILLAIYGCLSSRNQMFVLVCQSRHVWVTRES